MDLPVYLENILLFFTILGAALLGVYLLTRPFKWFFRWLFNGIAGVLVLFLLYTWGGVLGLAVPFNALTVIISALLGLPGVALIILRQLLF